MDIDELAKQCLAELKRGIFECRDDEDLIDVIKDDILYYHSQNIPETQPLPPPDPLLEWKREQFKIFYEKYGKRVGRVVAQRRFFKLKKSEIEAIIDIVDEFVASTPEVQYRPHPATFLAQRRWEDEIVVKPQRPKVEAKNNTWSY